MKVTIWPSRTLRVPWHRAPVGVLLLSVSLLSISTPSRAQSLRDVKYLEAIRESLGHIYRLEHDEAIKKLTELGKQFPEHPGPPLARSATIWLKELFARQDMDLERFISPGYFTKPSKRKMPEADQEEFFKGVAKSQELAEQYLEHHPGDKDARYYLGAAEGALGVFAFTIERSYLKALRHGKRSYAYQKAIVDEDPEFYDSYLTLGTYEYIIGNLPWYIKWIAAIAGFRGSEQRGFEYLILAADKSVFVSDDARVLLMVLYVREKQYEYGLEVAEQLHHRYPENFLIHLNKAQIMESMGRSDRAMESYLEAVRSAEEGKKNYQKLPLDTFRYTLGNRLAQKEYREQALALYMESTRDPNTPAREKALSHLRAGEILDLMGKREEAISQYEVVQKFQDFEGSHKKAREHIKKPYRRGQ